MESAIMSAMRGVLCSAAGVSEDEARDVCRWTVAWNSDAAVATTTAIAEASAGYLKRKCRLVGARLIPGAAVTGAATNFFTLLISKRIATETGVATKTTLLTFAADTATTDDISAFGAKNLMGLAAYITGAAADFDFAAGDIVTVEVTKAGTGMTFPAARVELVFEPRT
jgi:hypothetical protein